MQKLYIAIKDELLARIEDGTYPVGSTIPPETELAESYGVSRPTVRQALQLLVDAGYLDRRRRRGTIVCDPHASQEAKPAPIEDSAEMHLKTGHPHLSSHSGKHVKTATIRASRTTADHEVAEMLGVPVGEEVYQLVRVRYMDDEPNIFIVTHILARNYPNLLDTDFSRTGLYDRMAAVGLPVATARRRLEMQEADQTMADILDVPVGEALFLFRILGCDTEGCVVEYSRTTYRGKDNSFEFSTEHGVPLDQA